MKKLLSMSILLSAIFINTNAYVVGGSNLSLNAYPSFSSYTEPYNPSTASSYEMTNYKYEVEQYLENANYDIERIIEAKQKVINDYNDAVRRYNSAH